MCTSRLLKWLYCYWLFFVYLQVSIQRNWITSVYLILYTVVYTVIQLLLLYILLYISILSYLSYYRNFVYSPQSTQLHFLVTQFTYKDSSVASDWIARHISLFSCYRIDNTYVHLSLLLCPAMQLYGYATVCMLLYSVEYYRYIVNI